jgi:hypothetical protein
MSFQDFYVSNWLPINSLFGNMAFFEKQSGYSDFPLESFQKMCRENCQIFGERDACLQYCQENSRQFYDSTLYGDILDCDTTSCCHEKSGTNDFRFRLCRHALNSKHKKKYVSSRNEILLCVFMTCIFVCFLIIKNLS